MADNSAEIQDLLAKLQKAGAKISSEPPPSNVSSMSGDMLTKLDHLKITPNEFNAWVSWSKSF